MSDASLRQLRILHVVSSGGVPAAAHSTLLMPLLTRMPKHRVKTQVVSLSPNAVPGAVLRQQGVPVHDVSLSRHRFSFGAFGELLEAARQFRPDVIQAWGATAQIVSARLRKRCDWKPKLVFSIAPTVPLAKNAGLIDRQLLKFAAGASAKADRIVYASESSGAQHRRVGYPEGGHLTIPPGVDATRFKPDFAARRKVREELKLPPDAFVIGMLAPFQPESDHATLLKAVGELIKTNPNINVVLAGHGVQKGNAALMAMVGGGTLGKRAHLVGEWSDVSALFSACDVVCSSAHNDSQRMNLVMAMLCGIPCVATGLGAQGEVVGQFGVAIEAGYPTAFVKGITRIMQLPPEKRAFMAQGARKHALENYVYVRSLQKYLQLYYDLIGRQALVTKDMPTPEVDATVTPPPQVPKAAAYNPEAYAAKLAELADPDSIDTKVQEQDVPVPKWRVEQQQARQKKETEVAQKVAEAQTSGDVLEVFEAKVGASSTSGSPMNERARGVADESEELLPQEMLEAPVAGNKPLSEQPKPSAPAAAQPAPRPVEAKPTPAVKPTPAAKPVTAAKPVPEVKVVAEAKAAPEAKPAPEPKAEIELTLAPEPAPKPAPAVELSLAPEPTPVTEPAASAPAPETTSPEPETLSLFEPEAPASAPAATAESTEEATFQLELLPDPPPVEQKQAVGS